MVLSEFGRVFGVDLSEITRKYKFEDRFAEERAMVNPICKVSLN